MTDTVAIFGKQKWMKRYAFQVERFRSQFAIFGIFQRR